MELQDSPEAVEQLVGLLGSLKGAGQIVRLF
jgi:hypothetical protein